MEFELRIAAGGKRAKAKIEEISCDPVDTVSTAITDTLI